MILKYAPIAIFVYNRPDHTKKMIKSLTNCELFDKSKIYIFIDGPKDLNQIKKVKKVIDICNLFKKKNQKNIFIKKNLINKGLYTNLTEAITKILKKHKKIIVLEDDLILNKYFLKYMNNSLLKFKNNKKILQISGYSYPIDNRLNKIYLSRMTSCWGWGTWDSKWSEFNKFSKNKSKINNIYNSIKYDKKKKHLFNVNGSFNYFKFLTKQISSEFNSWGILFYLFSFEKKYLNIFPSSSLVKNIGFDGSGFHQSSTNVFNTKKKFDFKKLNYNSYYITNLKEDIKEQNKIENFLRSKLSFTAKLKNLIGL